MPCRAPSGPFWFLDAILGHVEAIPGHAQHRAISMQFGAMEAILGHLEVNWAQHGTIFAQLSHGFLGPFLCFVKPLLNFLKPLLSFLRLLSSFLRPLSHFPFLILPWANPGLSTCLPAASGTSRLTCGPPKPRTWNIKDFKMGSTRALPRPQLLSQRRKKYI